MPSPAGIWLVIQAIAVLIPLIVSAVRDGKIKSATEKEILDVFTAESAARVERAIAARDGPDDGLSDGFDRDAP
jgi:hypothetical protein